MISFAGDKCGNGKGKEEVQGVPWGLRKGVGDPVIRCASLVRRGDAKKGRVICICYLLFATAIARGKEAK